MKRSISIVSLCLAFCLLLTGCGIGLSDILIVKRAYEKVSDMDSMSFSLKGDLKGTAGKLPVEMSMKAKGSLLLEPGTLRLDLDLDTGILGQMEMPLYFYAQDDAIKVMAGIGDGEEQLWLSNSFPLSADEDQAAAMTVEDVLEILEQDPESITSGDTETINGLKARPFTIKIPGELLAQAAGIPIPQGRTLDTLILQVWIDEKDGTPLRLETELKDIVSLLLQEADSKWLPDLSIESLPVTVDLTGFNDVASIPLPAA